MLPLSIYLSVGSQVPFSGRLCMLAPSVCFWTPRLSLGHPGSFKSVHELKCMRTQTRPRFNVSSEGRGATFASNTQLPYLHCPSRDSNLGLLVWEASVLPLDHRDFCLSMFLPRFLCLSLWDSQSCYDFFKADIWFPSSWSSGSVLTHLHTLLVHALICRQHGWHSLLQRSV